MRKFIHWLWRSAVTGRFISRKEAEAHPDTTTREKLPMRDEGDLLAAPTPAAFPFDPNNAAENYVEPDDA